MSGFFDVYSIIFLVIAVVIFMRLGSVLGRRTGNEPSPSDPRLKSAPAVSRNDNVVALPSRDGTPKVPTPGPDRVPLERYAPAGTPLNEGLTAVTGAMGDFQPGAFLDGAKAAYELIVTAFADGDRATLKNLLAPEVYKGFEEAIAEREGRGERSELTFVRLQDASITEAAVEGRVAKIAVRFSADMISVTRNPAGEVVQGDATEAQTIQDAWTFARDVGSRDPNWKLVATEAV